MRDFQLTKREWNRAYEMIVESGFDPNDFERQTLRDPTEPIRYSAIRHPQSDAIFEFKRAIVMNEMFEPDLRWFVRARPLGEGIDEEFRIDSKDDLWMYFSVWLKFLKQECDAPDLWLVREQQSNAIEIIDGAADSKLDSVETNQVYLIVQNLRQALPEIADNDEQVIRRIEAHVGNIAASAQSDSRKTFGYFVAGVFFSILVQHGPSIATSLWPFFGQLIRIVGKGNYALPI